ncbi:MULTISPECIES: hypothetical protein [unclassified Curtobacterium]|uniref:hypothetical protein n=1 Tax=unclassified Curtobacterium TaxID=257496 RepID=UPI0010631FD8|nr:MULTISPECIES: hypothetical protein [unclassified Curtobacterium]
MKNFILGIVVLAVGALALWGVGWLLLGAFHWFEGLPKDTRSITGTIFAAVSVPVITFGTSMYLQGRRVRHEAVREQKTEFYEETIKNLIGMMNLGKSKTADTTAMVKIFAGIPAPLITFGSRGVILAWNNFRQVASESPEDTRRMVLAFEELFKQMRKDLKHPTWMHQPGELVGTFINDAQKEFKK